MPLDNPFISLTDRSYNQIKTAVLGYMATNTPEITDQNESNPLVRILSAWSGIAEMLGYYQDFSAQEAFARYVQLYSNAVLLADSNDYRINAAQSASALIRFTFQQTGVVPFPGTTIPAGTVIQTAAGIAFETLAAVVIPASALNTIIVDVDAVQRVATGTVALGFSDGTPSQLFTLPTKVAGIATVLVNAIAWASVESFAYAIDTDQSVRQSININKEVFIEFGDGVAGAIPTLAQSIEVQYYQTEGAAGNVDANTINNLITVVVVPAGFTLSVTNPSRASGGVDVEPLVYLQKRIPFATRTQWRAVTEADYITVAELNPQVAVAAVFFDCGKTVDVYIVPIGGGIATAALIAVLQAWMVERVMLTTQVLVLPAGEVQMQIEVTVRVKANYKRVITGAAVLANLLLSFSTERQRIGGTVHISDIYETIEAVEGVGSSTITKFVPRPYGRPLVGSGVLNWAVALEAGSSETILWRLIFTSATQFQLIKNNNFIGSFSVGVLVQQYDPLTVPPALIVSFTVSGSYAVGSQYEFYTYPYSATDITFAEMSIPVLLAADVVLNLTGGIV